MAKKAAAKRAAAKAADEAAAPVAETPLPLPNSAPEEGAANPPPEGASDGGEVAAPPLGPDLFPASRAHTIWTEGGEVKALEVIHSGLSLKPMEPGSKFPTGGFVMPEPFDVFARK